MFQHILLGMCGTSPTSPGRLVLSVATWTPNVQLLKRCLCMNIGLLLRWNCIKANTVNAKAISHLCKQTGPKRLQRTGERTRCAKCVLDSTDKAFLPVQATKPKAPSEEELEKEIVQTLSGVNVLEFNIKMLMKHLSECRLLLLNKAQILCILDHSCLQSVLVHSEFGSSEVCHSMHSQKGFLSSFKALRNMTGGLQKYLCASPGYISKHSHS